MELQNEFTVKLDRTELLESIAAVNHACALLAMEHPKAGTLQAGHLVCLANLADKLSEHLLTVVEEK